VDRQEEILAAGDPLCAIRRQAPSRHDHVDMRVMGHRRAPSMENRRDPNPRAQMLWIGGDLDHRVRARPHQEIVELPFVLVRDIRNRFRQSEDEMEIPHRQQLRFTCR